MTRAELVRDLESVASTLVLAVGALESLVDSLQAPQDGLELADGLTPGPVPEIPACLCPCCADERARGVRP